MCTAAPVHVSYYCHSSIFCGHLCLNHHLQVCLGPIKKPPEVVQYTVYRYHISFFFIKVDNQMYFCEHCCSFLNTNVELGVKET